MSNLVKLEFSQLDISGNNYMPWIVDMEMHLEAMDLLETLQMNSVSTRVQKAKSLIFIRRHLDEGLKNEYLTVKDPSALWENLRERYDHQKEVMLPSARNEWNALRFQDFKRVSEYNSAMFRLVSQLKFCGVTITESEMLEKTFSTFHASNVTLQQQYRVRGFQKYSELISVLLIAEKNNELLLRNHQSRPTGSKAFPEANAVDSGEPQRMSYFQSRERGRGRGRGRSRGWGRGRGRSHEQTHRYGRSGYFHNQFRKTANHMKHRDERISENPHRQGKEASSSKNSEAPCFRCGTPGHWAKVCRSPEHLCKLYKTSLQGKGKEVNFIDQDPPESSTHLNASDFDGNFVNGMLDFTNIVE